MCLVGDDNQVTCGIGADVLLISYHSLDPAALTAYYALEPAEHYLLTTNCYLLLPYHRLVTTWKRGIDPLRMLLTTYY